MPDTDALGIAVSRETTAATIDAARFKRSFYRHLMAAARFFAERARNVEARAPADAGSISLEGPQSVRHRSYVTGAILAAATFLEASINELYLELHGVRSQERARLPRRVLAELGRFWSDIERAPVLHRYQVVLMVADAERFDERRAPFHDADSLMKLRDALVHSRPERPESRRRQRTVEQRLHDRFQLNPLAPADSPWFPELCLSAGCAEWAFRAADAFSDEFCLRMSLPTRGLAWCDATGRKGRTRHERNDRAHATAALADGAAPNEGPPVGNER